MITFQPGRAPEYACTASGKNKFGVSEAQAMLAAVPKAERGTSLLLGNVAKMLQT